MTGRQIPCPINRTEYPFGLCKITPRIGSPECRSGPSGYRKSLEKMVLSYLNVLIIAVAGVTGIQGLTFLAGIVVVAMKGECCPSCCPRGPPAQSEYRVENIEDGGTASQRESLLGNEEGGRRDEGAPVRA